MRSNLSRLSILRRLSYALAIGWEAGALTAQCTTPIEVLGTDGEVRAVAEWDPDGAGPATPLWVIGGSFSHVGSVTASRLAAFDPATRTWTSLGGANDTVHALAVLANGNLLAAGNFTQVNGVAANRIARYDGTAWSPLGGGCDGTVRAIVERPNGEIVAGGDFSTAGSAGANRIASWNGSSWAPLGTGVDQSVFALILGPAGSVVAGGAFVTAGGVSTPHVARWDGAAWTGFGSVLPATVTPSAIRGLTWLPNGDLVAVGSHSMLFGSFAMSARWNGTAWVEMGDHFGTWGYGAVVTRPNGELMACSIAGHDPWMYHLDRWNGTNWVTVAVESGPLHALRLLASGDVLVGGRFGTAGINGYRNVARWDGTSWHGLFEPGGGAPQSGVTAMTTRPNGDVLAAVVGAYPAMDIVQWNGSAWSVLAHIPDAFVGMTGEPAGVTAMGMAPNGDLVVAGSFQTIGGVAANQIARWNGTTWAPLGGGMTGVRAMVWTPNGHLYVGRSNSETNLSGIMRWNGSAWSVVGSGLLGTVHCLRVLPSGDVLAGGEFNHDGSNNWLGKIARWNGTSWSAYGFGLALAGRIQALALLPNGDLMAGGYLASPYPSSPPTAALLWRWNGTWTAAGPIAGTEVRFLEPFPNGDLLVGGSFSSAGGVSATNVARWSGSTWSAIGNGLPGWVASAAWRRDEFWFHGAFGEPGIGVPVLARMTTSCPAAVTPLGVACVGPAGAVVLASDSLPWIGSAVHSRATGFAANTLAVHVLGLTSIAVPLPAILPQAVAGCSLLVSPDVLEMQVPVNGVVDLTVPVHPSIAFIGHPFYQQIVSLDLTTGDIGPVTSSNALEFVKGHF